MLDLKDLLSQVTGTESASPRKQAKGMRDTLSGIVAAVSPEVQPYLGQQDYENMLEEIAVSF